MRKKLKVKSGGGVQARRLGEEAVFFDQGRMYGRRKLGDQWVITPPPPPKEFLHPWKTSVRWYEMGEGLKNFEGVEIEGFGATVNPGLVSGMDPVAFGAWSDSAYVADVPSQGKYRRAPGLMDGPIVPLFSFKVVTRGPEMVPPVKIPLGLRQLGVDYAPIEASVSGSAGNFSVTLNLGPEVAQLYAGVTYLYLRTARPRVADKGDVVGGFFEGTVYNNTYDMTLLGQWGNRAQLMTGWPPENPPPRTPGPGPQTVTDLGFDTLPLVQIFVVSPNAPRRDARGNLIVDGGWIPFVRHLCYWNLEYRFDPKLVGNPLQLDNSVTGGFATILGVLGGGFGLGAVATQAALEGVLNKALADTASAMQINEMKGNFFTV
jgi:hypothetical protein